MDEVSLKRFVALERRLEIVESKLLAWVVSSSQIRDLPASPALKKFPVRLDGHGDPE